MKTWLKRRHRLNILKFIALLSIVRWYNILSILITQYLLTLFTIELALSKLEKLAKIELHLTFFATGLIMAGGFIINNFYDEEKDLINRPDQTIFQRIVSKNFSINAYVIFNALGLFIAYFLSKQIFGLSLIFAFLLWIYSHKLNKKPIVSNIAATVLMAFPFVFVPVFFRDITLVFWVYLGIFIMLNFVREIVKDLAQLKGDIIFGYQSIPVVLGVSLTKKLAIFLMLLSCIPLLSILLIKGISYLSLYFVFVALVIFFNSYLLYVANEKKGFNRVNSFYKFLIVTTAGSLLFL